MLPRACLLLAAIPISSCGIDLNDEDDPLAQQASAEPNIDAGLRGSDTQIADDAGSAGDARAPVRDAGQVQLNPRNAPFTVRVDSYGTGCPTGVEASLAPDGETFQIGFAAYTAQVQDGQRLMFRDCGVTLRFHGATSYSYAVTEFRYEGDAVLEPKVRAFATANHYTAGNPVPSTEREKRTDLTGPVERAFAWADQTEPPDRVWSPCGKDRSLQVVTRVGLQKTQNEGAGSVRLSALKVRLIWRACTP